MTPSTSRYFAANVVKSKVPPLERKEAVHQSSFQRHSAKCYFQKFTYSEKCILQQNVLRSVQSDTETTLEDLKFRIQEYRSLSSEQLTINLGWFKRNVKPLADSLTIKLNLNSDNPYSNLLGLPAVNLVG
ncbi:mannonate dehydratase [Desertivirga xinjiangensis]|uniref:mannonate dehydratase n=1 Tax=Desertivirga xinjiangensis TaxID=539206 RepID=UPI0034E269C7